MKLPAVLRGMFAGWIFMSIISIKKAPQNAGLFGLEQR